MLTKLQHLGRRNNKVTKDSELYHLSSDIQKIQIKTNMYLYEYGREGSFHLAREIIQNNFDECLDEFSNGNKIEISYDHASGILKTSDNGRSFNESVYPMATFATTIQSGSKFFRDAGSPSAGEFGKIIPCRIKTTLIAGNSLQSEVLEIVTIFRIGQSAAKALINKSKVQRLGKGY